MALQLQNDRIGVTALSFIGTLDLQPQYGIIGLKNVEAYITNNRLGPQFSAFGKVLFGRIGLDFTYLKEETTEEEAKHICAEVLRILDSFTNNA